MNKLVFFAMLCFWLTGCVSGTAAIKESDDINNSQFADKVGVMNPYEYYNLEKTNKLVIQMEKSVAIGPNNTIEVPLKKVLIDKEDLKAILSELNKEIRYDNDFCLCTGNGDLYFTLTDGTELKFRLKHGGEVLEERFDSGSDSRMFYPHDNFVKIIRKYYSDKMRKYYEIEDRRRRGEISDEQREQEWVVEIMQKYFPGDYWSNLVDDPVVKDDYFKKTIVGSWKIMRNDEINLFAVDTFLSDGEAWHKGEAKVSRSQWKIEDGYLFLTVESSDNEDLIPVGKKKKNKILFMDDKFMSLSGKDFIEIEYMKVD